MTSKRIGANRRKVVDAERARRPDRLKKLCGYAVVAAFVCGAGFAAYAYGPSVVERFGIALKNSKSLHADFRITNCESAIETRLRSALDSLVADELNYVEREDIERAAASISEIEKIRISKGKGKTTTIFVTEREPVAIVHYGDIRLVDKNGVRFTASSDRHYDLPLVNVAEAAGDTIDMTIFNAIKKTSLDLGGDFFQRISQIDLSGSTEINLILKTGRTEYHLAAGEVEKRLVHVKKLAEKFWGAEEAPERIDMRYRSLAFTSM